MAFYHPFGKPSVSQEFSSCQRDSGLFRYDEYSTVRTGLTKMLNIEHQLERESLEAVSSKSAIGERFESFQRESDFEGKPGPVVNQGQMQNATASLTKLNPKANPFIPRSIEWDKLPLRPVDPTLYPSSDLEFSEKSLHSPVGESVSYDFSDVMFDRFMQPYPMEISPQETRAFNFPGYEPRNQQQMIDRMIDRQLFQDSSMVDSHDMLHNFPNQTEKFSYTETKCYHCGCVGHLPVECYFREQGFDAVCFQCYGTGYKAASCPKKAEKKDSRMVDTNSTMKYRTGSDDETTTNGITAKFGEMDIGGRTWNHNSDLVPATNA